MNRTLASAVAILAALAVASAWAQAQAGAGYRVIVHPSNPQTSNERRTLADVFLKKSTRWSHGESIRPVDQTRDATARRRFSEDVLKRSVSAVKSYWQQAIFSGRGIPPAELDSDEAVVQFVLKHPGAVGYVSANAGTGDAKAIVVR
jgi:ABC-type phosphate transport system substrate-binding protein